MPVLQHSGTLTAAPRYIFQLCQICLCANERVSTAIVSLLCVFQFTSEHGNPTAGAPACTLHSPSEYFGTDNYTDPTTKLESRLASWSHCQTDIFDGVADRFNLTGLTLRTQYGHTVFSSRLIAGRLEGRSYWLTGNNPLNWRFVGLIFTNQEGNGSRALVQDSMVFVAWHHRVTIFSD